MCLSSLQVSFFLLCARTKLLAHNVSWRVYSISDQSRCHFSAESALNPHSKALAAVQAPPKFLQGQCIAINTSVPLGQANLKLEIPHILAYICDNALTSCQVTAQWLFSHQVKSEGQLPWGLLQLASAGGWQLLPCDGSAVGCQRDALMLMLIRVPHMCSAMAAEPSSPPPTPPEAAPLLSAAPASLSTRGMP